MENQPRFDLNEALAQWRLRLSLDRTVPPGQAVEEEQKLLSLLRDLQARGLTVEEAFQIARSRVDGTPLKHDQTPDSDQPDVWRQRLLWMVAALLGSELIFHALGACHGFFTVALGAWSRGWAGQLAFLGGWTVIRLILILGLVLLCQRASAASRVETWIAQCGILQKPAQWCATLVLILQGLACFQGWYVTRYLQFTGQDAVEAAKVSRELSLFLIAYQFEWPFLMAGLLLYLLWIRRREARGTRHTRTIPIGSPLAKGSDPTLVAAIEDWKRRLAAQRGVAADQAKEVASHLHDSAERFLQEGFPVEEALWLAHTRMGRIPEIAAHLRSDNPVFLWRQRIVWACLGLISWWALAWTLPILSFAFHANMRGSSTVSWRLLLGLLPLALRTLTLWALLGFALRRMEKPEWPSGLRVVLVRTAALIFIAVMIFLCIPRIGAGVMRNALEMSGMLHQGVNSPAFYDGLSQINAPFPSPRAGLPGLLAWLFMGVRMHTVLLAATAYVLMRPAAKPSAGAAGLVAH